MPSNTLLSAFCDNADARPAAPALSDGNTRLTYAQLRDEANSIALELLAQGLKASETVAVRLPPRWYQVICQAAVVLAHGVCFPVDQGIPQLRLQSLLERSQARFIISFSGLEGFEQISSQLVRSVNKCELVKLYGRNQSRTANKIDSRTTHLLHTSGSTGEPKIVQIPGDAILHLAGSTQVTPLRRTDKTLFVNDPSFDLALFEVWVTLLSGAEVVTTDKQLLLDGYQLNVLLQEKGVTVAFLSTGHFNFLAFNNPSAFSPLRILLTAGSAASPRAMRRVLENNPPEQLWNAYGPTETTTFVTLHLVDTAEASRPSIAIGQAIGNMNTCLLHEDGRRVSGDEVGEICISGPGVSLGYLDDPVGNRSRFVRMPGEEMPNSNNGSPLWYKTGDLGRFRKDSKKILEYIGRNDRQVKHNNYRVELGEVEAVVKRCESVLDAHVIQLKNPNDRLQDVLVACVLPYDRSNFQPRVVREFDKKYLPTYAAPGEIVPLDSVPLNPRGKVDYEALANEVNSRHEKVQSATSSNVKAELRRIWKDILGIYEIQENDDFFLLGASSLQAAKLTVRIRRTFSRSTSLSEIYENSRFLDMVRYFESLDTPKGEQRADLVRKMKADSHIADLIMPQTGSILSLDDSEGCVLLTGAIGFVGAFLLHHLLTTSPTIQSRIACLVRSRDNVPADARLQEALEKYELWETGFPTRVCVIDGDFTINRLGISADQYKDLAASVSTIFHFGAHVNFCQRYEEHFEANVLGTKNILHFASTGRPKSLHYASTIDAWGATGLVNGVRSVMEDEPLDPHIQGPLHDTGYSQSQWVSEQLVRRARDRGFPVAIYRLGTVICDSKRCIGNPKDFFSRVMVGCAKLGYFPRIENLRWEYVPVDYVCQVCCHIARSTSNLGRSYSIVSPDPKLSVSLERTCELLNEAGYPVKMVPYDEWVRLLDKDDNTDQSPLLALMPLIHERVLGDLTRFQTSKDTPTYLTHNTSRALEGTEGISYKPLDASKIRGMFRFWIDKGYHALEKRDATAWTPSPPSRGELGEAGPREASGGYESSQGMNI